MNSGVPGSPCSAGPPFHAYQYVRREPSASRFVMLLMPLSRTRMLVDPGVKIVCKYFGAAFASNYDDLAYFVDFDAGHLNTGRDHGLDGAGYIGRAEGAGTTAHEITSRYAGALRGDTQTTRAGAWEATHVSRGWAPGREARMVYPDRLPVVQIVPPTILFDAGKIPARRYKLVPNKQKCAVDAGKRPGNG